MEKFACCIILLIIFCGVRIEAEDIAEGTSAWDSALNEILKDEGQLEEDYEYSLLEMADNCSRNYKINFVLSSRDCSACNGVLSALMKAPTHTFLTINYLERSRETIAAKNAAVVPHIGNYRFILFLLKNISEFYGHFAELRNKFAWNPRAWHLIFLVEKPSHDSLENIFEDCWSHRVLNVAVIVRNRREAYTYNPYTKKPPKIWEEIIDWSKLFYDKLCDMNGRSIGVRYIPFSRNDVIKWIEEEGRFSILSKDFGIAEAFFQSINATPVYLNLTKDKMLLFKNFPDRYGIWLDRSFRGFELWLNIMPAGLIFHERSEHSYPVTNDNLQILAPKSGVKIPSIFEPYDGVTWLTILASLITFAIYSHVYYKSRGIADNAFLRTFGIFLGKNLADREHEPVEKGVFLILTTYSLLILNAYQGALYGALATATYYPEVETLLELSKVTKTVYAFQGVAEYLADDMRHGIKLVPFGNTEYIEFMETHRNAAYAFPNALSTYIAQQKVLSMNGVPFYHLMKGYSLPEFTVYTFPYGSPYVEKLERVTLACKEAGLVDYWNTLANLDALLTGRIIFHNAGEKTLKKLSLQTQLMAFYIWIAGLFISSCCFIAEIYFCKNEKSHKVEIKHK